MGKLHPVYFLSGSGTFNNNEVPRVVSDLVRVGLGQTIALAQRSDKNMSANFHAEKLPLPQESQMLIDPNFIRDAFGYHAEQIRATERAEGVAEVNKIFTNAHISRASDLHLETPFCLYSLSWTAGHYQEGVSNLLSLRERLHYEVTLANLVVPHEKPLRDAVYNNPYFPKTLTDEVKGRKPAYATLVSDDLSELTLNFGRPFQDEMRSLALSSAMAAPYMFSTNKSIADMVVALANYEKCLAISCGVEDLPTTKTIWWYDILADIFNLQKKGRFHIPDTITATKLAITQAIDNPTFRMMAESPSDKKAAYLYIVLPLKLTEWRNWRTISQAVELWIARNHPWITCQWVSGPTLALPTLPGSAVYHVNCCLFYPISHHNKVIQQIIDQAESDKASPNQSNGTKPQADRSIHIITQPLKKVQTQRFRHQ